MEKNLYQIQFHPEIFTIMGEKLVSDPVIAISELVKNSYDADASKVYVRIRKRPAPYIIIEDDGHGMTFDDIEKGWLMIGTPKKRIISHSREKNRVFSGSMGIGRLAAFSIANRLVVETSTKEGEYKKFSLNLNEMKKHENISDIKINVDEIKDKTRKRGTILKLLDLKWNPSKNDIKRLRMKLSILTSPKLKTYFSTYIDISGKVTFLDPSKELPNSPLFIDSTIDEKGLATVTITPEKKLYVGNKKIIKKEYKLSTKYEKLKHVELNAYWYPLGIRPKERYWEASLSRNFINEMRENIAGVRVYRDGIRVLPYGNPDNDWLELERKYTARGPMRRNPRRVQIVGWIYISKLINRELEDTANREGLIESESLQLLKEYAQEVFEKFADYRRGVEPIVKKEQEISLIDVRTLRESINKLRSKLTDFPELKPHLDIVDKYFDTFTVQLDKEALYRDKLTAGNMINLILHDVGASTKSATNYILEAADIDCEINKHDSAFDLLTDLVPRINSAYDILKGGSTAGAERRIIFEVTNMAEKLVTQLRSVSYLKEDQIVLEAKKIKANMRKSDFWALIANLLLNAITCAQFEQARERKFPPKKNRKIVFIIKKNAKNLEIICEDNGPGLPDQEEGWIWIPFNSTREGAGSGLGLYIVSEIVKYYSGTKIAKPSEMFPTGTRFEITLSGVVV